MNLLLYSLGPGGFETPCASSKSIVSVSSSSAQFMQSLPTVLQSQILWGLLFLLPGPQAMKINMGFRTFTPMEELLWYTYFPVCESSTCMIRFDFIMIVPLLPSLCGFFFVFGCSVIRKRAAFLQEFFLKMKLTS